MEEGHVEEWVRINSYTGLFFEICETSYSEFLEADERLQAYRDAEVDDDSEESSKLQADRDALGMKAIVFGGMCVEAAIYDYAATHLGDNFFGQHFEKLDVLSKWVLIPKLVCGDYFRKDRAAYAKLKELVQARNRLVHHKSKALGYNQLGLLEQLQSEKDKFIDDVHNAYRALVLLDLEMDYLVGSAYNPIHVLDPDIFPPHEVPANLKSVVVECKNIMASARAAITNDR